MALVSMKRNCLSGSPAALDCDETPAGFDNDVRTQMIGTRNSTGFESNTRRLIATTYSCFLVSVVLFIMISTLIQPLYANPTCILNCAQCVKIYGEFFDGHSCAKVCMESRAKFESFVDCADPTTIARFLKSY